MMSGNEKGPTEVEPFSLKRSEQRAFLWRDRPLCSVRKVYQNRPKWVVFFTLGNRKLFDRTSSLFTTPDPGCIGETNVPPWIGDCRPRRSTHRQPRCSCR